MRILVVSEDIPYPNMGGLAKHALNLARALVRAGHEVDILGGDQHALEVAGDEGKFGGQFFGELNGHHAGWKELTLGMLLPPKRTWVAKRFAGTILRHAHRYDVIHYHGHVPNVARFVPAGINFIQTPTIRAATASGIPASGTTPFAPPSIRWSVRAAQACIRMRCSRRYRLLPWSTSGAR